MRIFIQLIIYQTKRKYSYKWQYTKANEDIYYAKLPLTVSWAVDWSSSIPLLATHV